MKKFLLTIFVIGLLVFAAIAAVPILTKVVGPDMMLEAKPPTGVPFGYREFPIPERSILAVKLDLPVSALEDVANRDIPAQLAGVEKKDLHKKIKEGTIQWKMMPGHLTLQNTGHNLAFTLPINGNADATGRFGLFKIRVKGNAGMKGVITGDLTPVIDSDWQVSPNLTTNLNISHAVANYGRNGSKDIRDEVQSALEPKIKAEKAKIGPGLTDALNMQEGVQNLWKKTHLTKLMTKDPASWLVFDPAVAQMGPIDYSNPSSVSVTMGMVAQTFITNTEVGNREAEKIPYLHLVDENPKTELRVPIIANFKALNSSLADDEFVLTSKSGAKTKVSKLKLELADKGRLNLTLDVNTLSGVWGKGLSGTLQLQANPMVDCPSQTLGFTNVKMSVRTREVFSGTAAWLLEEMLVKAIEKELRIDLKEHLPKVENEIYKVVNAAKVPEHIELCFEKPKVELLGVYTIERNAWNEEYSPGIVFVFGAKGDISVKLIKI